jgi:two-component system, OmpR family, response regulator
MTAPATASRVLIVDDDPALCEMLSDLLESNGMPTVAVGDGAAMQRALAEGDCALLLLDLRLKREDGLTLARAVRESSDIPIIIMSGKGDETDRILGLELVADDYLTKPFNPRELVARVRAVLRRTRPHTPRLDRPAPAPAQKVVNFGGFVLNLDARVLFGPDGQQCKLTANEYSLLETLVRNANRVLSRDQLLEHMRPHDSDVFDRAIDVLVLRLRRKIESNPASPRFIRTERGMGYIFSASDGSP